MNSGCLPRQLTNSNSPANFLTALVAVWSLKKKSIIRKIPGLRHRNVGFGRSHTGWSFHRFFEFSSGRLQRKILEVILLPFWHQTGHRNSLFSIETHPAMLSIDRPHQSEQNGEFWRYWPLEIRIDGDVRKNDEMIFLLFLFISSPSKPNPNHRRPISRKTGLIRERNIRWVFRSERRDLSIRAVSFRGFHRERETQMPYLGNENFPEAGRIDFPDVKSINQEGRAQIIHSTSRFSRNAQKLFA